MSSAIKNLFIFTWVTIACGFIGWSYARHSGLAKTVPPPFDHPFLRALSSSRTNLIAIAPRGAEPLLFLRRAAQQTPKLILWLDARPRLDGILALARDAKEAETAPALEAVLAQFPEHEMILNVRGYHEGVKESLLRLIDRRLAERLILQSPEDGFLKDLREAKPDWIFGTSAAQITRLIMLSSVGLESTAPIQGDALVVNDRSQLIRFTDRAIVEAHRRQRKVFLGPVRGVAAAKSLRSRGVDGVLVEDPEDFAPVENQL